MLQPEMMQSGMMMQQPVLIQPLIIMCEDNEIKWGWEKLPESQGILIQQRYYLMESSSGERGYNISSLNTDDSKSKSGKGMFNYKERASWCVRTVRVLTAAKTTFIKQKKKRKLLID